jgi:hypothetical protein
MRFFILFMLVFKHYGELIGISYHRLNLMSFYNNITSSKKLIYLFSLFISHLNLIVLKTFLDFIHLLKV